MSSKRFVINKCEDCPHMEVEEYTANIGFPFVKIFLHYIKTDLYVKGFKNYQNKDGSNNIQLQKSIRTQRFMSWIAANTSVCTSNPSLSVRKGMLLLLLKISMSMSMKQRK